MIVITSISFYQRLALPKVTTLNVDECYDETRFAFKESNAIPRRSRNVCAVKFGIYSLFEFQIIIISIQDLEEFNFVYFTN